VKGSRTCVVLGAGASHCYADGLSNIPMQRDMIGRLFHRVDTSSGQGAPSLHLHSGLVHSFQLGQYLRQRYQLAEDTEAKYAKLDFWRHLQDRGFNLESLYVELDQELPPGRRHLLDEFQSIIRTAITEPVGKRKPHNVCRYHRQICEFLEPGDYVVDFNWDSLMADALLHCCHFWFPLSGFGYPALVLLPQCQKALPVQSLVDLFHIHGSILLYEREGSEKNLLYLGPEQWEPMSGLLHEYGISLEKEKKGAMSLPGNEETHYRLFQLGHLLIRGVWYRPVFIPPSRQKSEYSHWYFRVMKCQIHQRLPSTQLILMAGYSFPETDLEHLGSVFVREVLPPDIDIQVVNPSNEESNFRDRVAKVFKNIEIDYSIARFEDLVTSISGAK